ncbi:hypothetical protein HG531_005251 [Fusarium graminearum]|nr:hypothetical protein HG531_005251 [Fusarium graminearum]
MLLENASKCGIIAPRDQLLHLLDLGLGKERSGKLQKLEDLRVSRYIQWQFALGIGNGIIDILLFQKKLHHGGSALDCGQVKRGVSILVTSVDIDRSLSIGQDVFNDREFGTLDSQMKDCSIIKGT